MKKILVATQKPFAPEAVKGIEAVCKEAGYEFVLLEKYAEQQDFVNAVADVNAIIIRSDKVTAEVIEAAKNLEVVVRAGAGYDNVDLDAATKHNVVVMNTPGQNSNAVAELALGMMVFMARGGFNGKPGTELKEKSIGIHAYGNVGQHVARIAKGFGMEVCAFDPFVKKAEIEADGVKALDSAEELYKSCQYISLHIPANEKTKASIGKALLGSMPKDACLVNTARKEVINEAEMMELMAEREDFTYLSDIAPDCADDIAAKFEGRYFFTPKKMGAQTKEANVNAGIAAIEQIVAMFEKGDKTFQVNK
ncbi:MAG: NAD(P)-dependent oxidoreductase [Bacteroidales bacterium]|jgi:D-3-phosphoglycerate dehydrogenase|nr:NAD(P)-dependent oxidoreductase [Bacteroidales bacterium]